MRDLQGFLRGRGCEPARGQDCRAALHPRDLHGGLRGREASATLRGALWGPRRRLDPHARRASLAGLCSSPDCWPAAVAAAARRRRPGDAGPGRRAVLRRGDVRPEGELRDDALAAAGKVLRTDDPEAKIRELMQLASTEGRGLRLRARRRAVAGRAGWRVGSSARRDERRAGRRALATTDTDAGARQRSRRLAERDGGRRSHRALVPRRRLLGGLRRGRARGVVDDFVVIGDRGRSSSARSTRSQGDSLADADDVPRARSRRSTTTGSRTSTSTRGGCWSWRPSARTPQLGAALSALVPCRRAAAGRRRVRGGRRAARARRRELPARSAGAARPLLGTAARPCSRSCRATPGAARSGRRSARRIATRSTRFAGARRRSRRSCAGELGLDLERDLLDWIGDAAFFVRGATLGLDRRRPRDPADRRRRARRARSAARRRARSRARGGARAGGGRRRRAARSRSTDQAPKPIVLAARRGLRGRRLRRRGRARRRSPDDRARRHRAVRRAPKDVLGDEPSLLVLSMPARARARRRGGRDRRRLAAGQAVPRDVRR